MDKNLMEMLNKKKVFIFDFDNTLADTDFLNYETMRRLLAKDNIDFTREDYGQVTGKTALEYNDIINRMYNKNYKLEDTVKNYLEEYRIVENEVESKPFDYVGELFDYYKDKKKVILSNMMEDIIVTLLKKWAIADNFEKIYSCVDLNIKKNQFYKETAKYLGVEQKDCVVFEDTQRYIDQAKSLGIDTVGIEKANDNTKLSSNYIIQAR